MRDITLTAYLESLRSRRAKLDALITSIEEELGQETSTESGGESSSNVRQRPPRGPYHGMTIIDAAIKFLGSVGSPQLTRDIQRALWQGGLKSSSRSPYRTVYSTLRTRFENKGDIVKKGSKWGLKEWEDSPEK